MTPAVKSFSCVVVLVVLVIDVVLVVVVVSLVILHVSLHFFTFTPITSFYLRS